MNKLHEKSPCCGSKIHHFGTRRRQCSSCKKTWRVWKKIRGRKRRRLNVKTLFNYFDGHLKPSRLEKRTVSARLRILLREYNNETPWPKVPEGRLIAVADGLIEFFKEKNYTIYIILVRSIDGSKAFILPPYMREGGEVVLGWHEAFEQVPNDVFVRIEALVCDGHGGLIRLAKTNQWILQRCHFHLLARIGHYASFGSLNKTKGMGLRVKGLVEVVLYQKDSEGVLLALEALKKIKMTMTSRSFKTVISGFVRHYQDYRAYMDHPQYFLPTTSNSAEYLNARIRDLQYRARGFRTPQSLFAWITGLCKHRKSVTCRGKNQPN